MSEPILERLSRFTPDAGGLDRDALLFAAGRASARPNRGWMTLASLLAGTQALSLRSCGGTRTRSPAAGPSPSPGYPRRRRPPSPRVPRRRRTRACGRPAAGLRESEAVDRPAGDMTFIESEPPLRAFPPPPSLLN